MTNATGAPLAPTSGQREGYGAASLAMILGTTAGVAAAGTLWMHRRAARRAKAISDELESTRRELAGAEDRLAASQKLLSERETSLKELERKCQSLQASLDRAVGDAGSSRSRMFMMERELEQTKGMMRRLQEENTTGGGYGGGYGTGGGDYEERSW